MQVLIMLEAIQQLLMSALDVVIVMKEKDEIKTKTGT